MHAMAISFCSYVLDLGILKMKTWDPITHKTWKGRSTDFLARKMYIEKTFNLNLNKERLTGHPWLSWSTKWAAIYGSGHKFDSGQTITRGLKTTEGSLCNYNRIWLDFQVFSDKNYEPLVPPHKYLPCL